MKHTVLLWISVIPIILAACTQKEPIRSTPLSEFSLSVISLKETLPRLFKEARKWSEDAYLVNVVIEIEDSESIGPLTATFYSVSNRSQVFVIKEEIDGSIMTEIINQEKGTILLKPITENDWKYDSQEVLNLFLEDTEIRKIFSEGSRTCNLLDLSRIRYTSEQQLLWRLLAGPSCLERESYYLDPITGKRTEKPPVPEIIPTLPN